MYAAFVLIIAALGCMKDVTAFDASLNSHWSAFLHLHAKAYVHEEESRRRGIWETNIGLINRHNLEYDLGLHSYRQGVNWYTDWGYDEIAGHFHAHVDSDLYEDATAFSHPVLIPSPDSYDWRTTGCVTPVKDMGSCGASWAFSATGSVESNQCLKTGYLVPLSEQNLIDCSGPQGNNGCDGGTVINAYRYIKENHGLDTEKSYPYTGVEGRCKYDPDNNGAIVVTGYFRLSSTNEDLLKWFVANYGPTSAVIDATLSFFLYSGGIYDEPDCSSTDVNYSVLVVGYGSEDGRDYWIVKNSQGLKYGEEGYIRMSRNKNNQCGIATRASYPLLYDDTLIGDPDLSNFPTHLKF